MLDPLQKIGYLRIVAVDYSSVRATRAILANLAERGCRGLILDLRWCPGGDVNSGVEIASLLLAPNTVVARVEFLPNVEGTPAGQRPSVYNPQEPGPRYAQLPVVMLVGPETLGGGELIAAALQENGRAAVAGQRSAGRAAMQEQIDLGYGGLQFKATYGTTLRPNGKPRHRTPTSTPTDDWGIRPDRDLEVPVTPAVAAQLRAWAEEHALRLAGSRDAVPFDDPDRDPPRAAALAHLRKRLVPPPAPAEN
jgi:carboxyl-terminal processing protease